jgi:DNA (cytosine-5)-methyltransferase 1
MRHNTHLGLFAGIGGFEYAAKLMGWHTMAWCEINEFCQQVLRYHFPEATGHSDIITTDFTPYANRIDVLTGGFPCQPYSAAGKRLGKADERHLWPQMLRAIREIRPRYVVGENVRGLTNWNGGVVFDEVQADLETEGYEVLPFLLPACAVNAPHRRDRIWFVAYNPNTRIEGMRRKSQNTVYESQITSDTNKLNGNIPGFRASEIPQHQPSGIFEDIATYTRSEQPQVWTQIRNTKNNPQEAAGMDHRAERSGDFGNAADTNGERLRRESNGIGESNEPYQNGPPTNWQNFPTQPPVCSGDDGLPTQLDGITFSKWRNESIKAYGNAVVPPLVLEIYKAIDECMKLEK